MQQATVLTKAANPDQFMPFLDLQIEPGVHGSQYPIKVRRVWKTWPK